MFGKGLYFGDMAGKSVEYCVASQSNNEGLLLLSEVVIGPWQELREPTYLESLSPPYRSARAIGQYQTSSEARL
jgi:hypothetical protein